MLQVSAPVWAATAGLALALDYASGAIIAFPIAYVVPVSLSAWAGHPRWSLFMGLSLPLVRGLLEWRWHALGEPFPLVINALVRMVLLCGIALAVHRVRSLTDALSRRVDTLSGLLPICSFCHKIRDDRGEWQRLETYVSARSAAQFSHGLCAECERIHYPDTDE